MSRRVGVIGQSQRDERLERLAYRVGRLLAEAGCLLYSGGLGGMMEAACQGAFEAGGTTVGILPGSEAADANPYVRIPVVTGIGEARNAVLVKSVEAVIAVGRGYGTLSEIALALRRGIPLVLLESWEVDAPAVRARSPEEAVTAIMRALERG